jgi:hypothetical protein
VNVHAQQSGRPLRRVRRGGGGTSQRGAGLLMFIWFLLMVVSVGLMYYYYLKSERLERELRLLREKHGVSASGATSSSSPELVVADGVAPETLAVESTASASNVSSSTPHEERSAPGEHEPPIATRAAAASPTPVMASTPPPTPEAVATATPQVRLEAGSEASAAAHSTPADGGGAGATRPKPRSSPRTGRINSVYDLQQSGTNR